MLHPSGGFAQNGEYASLNVEAVHDRRFGSWNGSDRNVGQLVSEPFVVLTAVSFFVDGYPTRAGEAVYLERADNGARYPLVPSRDPGEAWTRVRFFVPPGWFGRTVRLHGVDASRDFRGWIGIAEVRTELIPIAPVDPWFAVAWTLLVLTAVSAGIPLRYRRNGSRGVVQSPLTFCGMLAAALLWIRLPSMTSGAVLNADEAPMTAQAITFLRHPVPWVDFDGTTSGPLNSIVVSAPALLGLAPTLPGSRLIGTLLLVVLLVGLYAAGRRLWGEIPARIAVLLPFALLCAGLDGAYVSYVSELLPLAMAAIACACLAELAGGTSRNPLCAGLIGIAGGAMPFAKLQAAPIAALLVVTCAFAVCVGTPRNIRAATFVALLGGLLSVPTIVLSAVAVHGGIRDFWISYIVFPRVYVAGNCCTFAGIPFFFQDGPFAAFFSAAILTIAAFAIGSIVLARRFPQRGFSRKVAGSLAVSMLMVIAAIVSIETPYTPFLPYLLWLIPGVTGVIATTIGSFQSTLRSGSAPRWVFPVSVMGGALVALAPVTQGALRTNPYLNHDPLTVQAPIDRRAPSIQGIVGRGQRVVMWGWMPQYLVYADAVMGTRDSISQFQIEPRPFREHYRDRYLRDFVKNRPDFVLEAVGPEAFAYHDRRTQGIESFPQLQRIVMASYAIAVDAESVRLWKRRPDAPVR